MTFLLGAAWPGLVVDSGGVAPAVCINQKHLILVLAQAASIKAGPL